MTLELTKVCSKISGLFEELDGRQASSYQVYRVAQFRKEHPDLINDLDFCFEVLAGKHKLGFTLYEPITSFMQSYLTLFDGAQSIKEVYDIIVKATAYDKTEDAIYLCLNSLAKSLSVEYMWFIIKLFNREYKLGYSNRKNMVTNLHCMLAQTYPAGVTTTKQYYVQEKLNGNRCIAWFDQNLSTWRYTSRSQKAKIYPFDLSALDPRYVYDGEVLSRGAMGNRDFSKTSGLANSKYGDKSNLVYIIYDILDSTLTYEERWTILQSFLHTPPTYNEETQRLDFEDTRISFNVAILPVLAKITVYPNPEYNWRLDKLLDDITAQGGEGIMLRDPDAPYYHSAHSGDRPSYLLKYKKTKTCDLRIIGWNDGKGKYEGMIGSFLCETDDHTIRVNVAGIDDNIRASDPYLWIGKIIEVAYFEQSQSKSKSISSLQFPRYKRCRPDKTETSMY